MSFKFLVGELIDVNSGSSDLFSNLLQVFSAFGFVHKIATFEKNAGFQVCIMVRVTWLWPVIGCILYSIACHSEQQLSLLLAPTILFHTMRVPMFSSHSDSICLFVVNVAWF
jgi:hypothetical protein